MSDRERWEEIMTDLWCDSPGLSHELACKRIAEQEARIAELEALLPEAFRAGSAWCCSANDPAFKVVAPDQETWVRKALGGTDA